MDKVIIMNELEKSEKSFNKLSSSRKSTLKRDANKFIKENPGCADNKGFWKTLSARQVTLCK